MALFINASYASTLCFLRRMLPNRFFRALPMPELLRPIPDACASGSKGFSAGMALGASTWPTDLLWRRDVISTPLSPSLLRSFSCFSMV